MLIKFIQNSKNSGIIAPIILFLIILLIGIVVVGNRLYNRQTNTGEKTNNSATIAAANTPTPTIATYVNESGKWARYTNPAYGYSIEYPPLWKIREPNSDHTIVAFESPDYWQADNPYEAKVLGGGTSFYINVANEDYKQGYEGFQLVPDFKKKLIGEVTIDNTVGLKGEVLESLTGNSGAYIFLPFKRENVQSLTISYGTFEENFPQEIIDRMISSFKFN